MSSEIEELLDRYDQKIRLLIVEIDELKAIRLCSDLAILKEIIISGYEKLQSQIDAINKEGDEDESQQEQSV